jgi:hypothetical protein
MPFILNLFYYEISVAVFVVVECIIIPVVELVICMHHVWIEIISM